MMLSILIINFKYFRKWTLDAIKEAGKFLDVTIVNDPNQATLKTLDYQQSLLEPEKWKLNKDA